MLVFIIVSLFASVKCQVDLVNFFGECQKTEETFDDCVKDGLNSLRAYFKTGLPDYNIAPFDPFFAAEVPQKRSGPFFNYKLILRNVTESGWTSSQVNKFRTDFNKHFIEFTQFFPDKKLSGLYEIEGTFFGNKITNQGSWNLNLFDYVQTMTVTRKPRRDASGQIIPNPPLKVQVNVQSCNKLELHIGHLAGGRTIVENMLDWVINNAWQPGFVILRPLINDLVATAFTEILNKNFQNFPFEKVFPN
ncbi:uncharacterized protein LOC123012968 isoform X1 [Tribolium madens]|uniref:uncharacterized protein LOC123012968 isoform X1 n=1 Tax=Tribolium madens TaxID=41895 RepID=UPI001CF72A8B|nr:uncharacterized protein LOC123012968 isoform X1 [Tribolium madens]